MTHHKLKPQNIAAPLANYSPGILVPAGQRLIATSGQLGMDQEGRIPETVEEQAEICFHNIIEILAQGDMTLANVVRLNAYVTSRDHMAGYMSVRDRLIHNASAASTLMIVSGFTRPEFKVEVEALAAAV